MDKYLKNYEFDDLDKSIIRILMENAKTPYTEIAQKLLVSGGTIHVRMKKMEEMGIVKNAVLLINPSKLGFDLSCFVGIHLKNGSIYEEVIGELKKINEVVEAYYTTGTYSIFIKIYCFNTKHLYDVLNHKIQSIKGIQGTETLLCLEESIMRQIVL